MGRMEEIAEEMTRVIPVFVRKVHAGTIQHMPLTPAQFFVLLLVDEKGSSRIGDISHELEISPPTATGIVDRLQRDGYVKRVHDKQDRRVVNIVLTKKGKALLANTHKGKYERIKQILRILTPEDQESYLRIIKILIEGMDNV